LKNGGISNSEGLVTLTLSLDRVILHTVVHHLSTSTYTPNFIEIEGTWWMDGARSPQMCHQQLEMTSTHAFGLVM